MKVTKDNRVPFGMNSRSLYGCTNLSGLRATSTPRLVRRNNVFKAPINGATAKRGKVTSSSSIPRFSQSRVCKRGAPAVSKPVIPDFRLTRFSHIQMPLSQYLLTKKKNLDRMMCLSESRKKNLEQKCAELNNQISKTPREQSICDSPFLKRTEFQQKSVTLGSNQCISETPISFFESDERQCLQNEQTTLECGEKENVKTKDNFNKKFLSFDIETNTGIGIKPVNKFSSSTPMEKVYDELCVFSNILRHCELYYSKLSNVFDALECLDASFQKAMAVKTNGKLYSNFCKYQTEKQDLYRKMNLLEEELEESVRREVNLEFTFKEYLKKKEKTNREMLALYNKFKASVEGMISSYKEEAMKPPSGRELEDIVKAIVSPGVAEGNRVETPVPVLRRSLRLMRTPIAKTGRSGGRSSPKNGSEDFVIKRNTRSSKRKRLQRSIYEDLQKGFNLDSPEASF